MSHDQSDLIKSSAVVIFGDCFFSSALRGIITSVLMKLRAGASTNGIFANIEDAAEWLAPRSTKATGVEISQAVLLRVLREVCAEYPSLAGPK